MSYFNLFADCVAVKGYKESCIYDLSRNKLYPISNKIFEIIERLKILSLNNIIKEFPKEAQQIKGMTDFFTQNNIGFECVSPSLFPEINYSYEVPNQLFSLSIEVSSSISFTERILIGVKNENINSIHLMMKEEMDVASINRLLKVLENSPVRYLELSYSLGNDFSITELIDNISLERISRIYSICEKKEKSYYYKSIYIDNTYSSFDDFLKPINSYKSFVINLKSFSEAKSHNLALNKHAHIDSKGNVYNHYGHSKIHGNLENNSLLEILNISSIKKFWNINNDKIEKCKFCQFRYCCYDISEISFKNKKYRKVRNCKFNPILNEWKN